MTVMSFGEWRPDLTFDLDQAHTRSILNVLPRGDGYGPMQALVSFTTAVGAPCRGMFYARNDDGSVTIFAATATNLYMLQNATFTWENVSQGGGPYTALPANAHWQFAQFGQIVIAVQPNVDPQKFDLGSPMAFEDLGDDPPRAAYIAIVNRFVVLSGLTDNPTRTQWCGIDDIENWTAGTGSGDFQDLPDGGNARNVVGGEFGIILQDFAVRRMIFAPGSELIFQIDRIGKDQGVLAPYSVCASGNLIFFLSPQGFVQMDANGGMIPIGREKVDRTFFADWDDGQVQLVMAAADPRAHKVLFVYKRLSSSGTTWDRGLIYDWLLKRWSPLMIEGEFISSLSRPGLTLEGLDALAPGAMAVTGAANNGSGLIRITVADTDAAPYPIVTGQYRTISGIGGTTEANGTWQVTRINGTTFDLVGSVFANAYTSGGIVGGSVDLMEFPFDDISTGTLPQLSAFNSSHELGFFSGDTLEATMETPEQSNGNGRLRVQGFWPLTDAPTVYGSISKRENLNASPTYTNESLMSGMGFCAMIRDTRYSKAKIRIPAATAWTYASGVRPEATGGGMH